MADYLKYPNAGPSYRVTEIQDAIRKLGDYQYYDKNGNLITFYPNITGPKISGTNVNLIGYEFAVATIVQNMKDKDAASFLTNTGFGYIENTSIPAFGDYYLKIEQFIHDAKESEVSPRIYQERQDIYDQFTKIKQVFDAYRAHIDDPDYLGTSFEAWATTAIKDTSTNKTYNSFLSETIENNEPVYSYDGKTRLYRGDVDYLKMLYAIIPTYFNQRDIGYVDNFPKNPIPRKSRSGIVDTELAIAGYRYGGGKGETLGKSLQAPNDTNRTQTYSLILREFKPSTIKSGYQRWDPIILGKTIFIGKVYIQETFGPDFDGNLELDQTDQLDYGSHDILDDQDRVWGVLREPQGNQPGEAGFVPQGVKQQNVRVWVVQGTQNVTATVTTGSIANTTGITVTPTSGVGGRKFYLTVEEKPYDITSPNQPGKIEVTDKKYTIPSSPSLIGTLNWCDDRGNTSQIGSAFALAVGKVSYNEKMCFYPQTGTIFSYSYYYDIKDISKNINDFLGATKLPETIYPGGIYTKQYIDESLDGGVQLFAQDISNICNNTSKELKGPIGLTLSVIRKNAERYRIVTAGSTLNGTKPNWVSAIESSVAMSILEHSIKSAKYTDKDVIVSPSDIIGEYWSPNLEDFEGVLKSKTIFGEIRNCVESPVVVTGPCLDEKNWEVFLEPESTNQNPENLYIPDAITKLVTKLPTGGSGYQFIDNGILKLENKELYKKYVIEEQNRNTITNFVDIPQSRCLRGRQIQYNRFVKYDVKYIFSIRCNNGGSYIPIDYLGESGRFGLASNNSAVYKSRKLWLREYLYGRALSTNGYSGKTKVIVHFNGSKIEFDPGSFVDNADNKTGLDKALHTLVSTDSSGMPFKFPLIDSSGNIGYYDYVEIQFNGNVDCGSKRVTTEKKIDPSDSCGCTEYDEFTTLVSYDTNNPEFKYNHVNGDVTTVTVPTGDIKLGITTGARTIKDDCIEPAVRIYHPFMFGKDILTGVNKDIIKGLFNTSQSLSNYYTSSTQNTDSKNYHYAITDCSNCSKTPYFSVAYGHADGSGSLNDGGDINDTPSRAIYSQYRLMALESPNKLFEFYNNAITTSSNEIYVINFNRNGINDRLDPGNFEINLAEINGGSYINNVYTGSNVQVSSSGNVLTLIDNSNDFSQTEFCYEDPYYYYDIVSGSLQNGIHSTGAGSEQTNLQFTTYGMVYPNLGIIVLDGKKLNVSASFNTVTGSNISGNNSHKIFTAISGAAVLNKPMKARNVKRVSTNHYFVRVPSNHANYTSNPTYIVDTGDQRGRILYECFVENPVTYVTTVGLYNSSKELLAVAKLSKPVKKTPQTDILVKIRLNW